MDGGDGEYGAASGHGVRLPPMGGRGGTAGGAPAGTAAAAAVVAEFPDDDLFGAPTSPVSIPLLPPSGVLGGAPPPRPRGSGGALPPLHPLPPPPRKTLPLSMGSAPPHGSAAAAAAAAAANAAAAAAGFGGRPPPPLPRAGAAAAAVATLYGHPPALAPTAPRPTVTGTPLPTVKASSYPVRSPTPHLTAPGPAAAAASARRFRSSVLRRSRPGGGAGGGVSSCSGGGGGGGGGGGARPPPPDADLDALHSALDASLGLPSPGAGLPTSPATPPAADGGGGDGRPRRSVDVRSLGKRSARIMRTREAATRNRAEAKRRLEALAAANAELRRQAEALEGEAAALGGMLGRLQRLSVSPFWAAKRAEAAAQGRGGAQYVLMLEHNTVELDCEENELIRGIFAVCDDVRYADGRRVLSHSSPGALDECYRFFEKYQALWVVPQPHAVGNWSWNGPLSRPVTQAPYRKQLKTVDGEVRVCEHGGNGYSLLSWELMPNPVPRSDVPVRLQSDLFLLEEFRGFPGMFKVVDKMTGTVCCLKQVYRIGSVALAREAELLFAIPHHPHIVRLHGLVGNLDGMVDGILLTYISGASLDQVTEATDEQRTKWIGHIRSTLDFLHGQTPPVVWGDIKAANVMIRGGDDRAILIDFGGSYTPGWVDSTLAETREGDEQGFSRLVTFINNIGKTGRQGAPSAAGDVTRGVSKVPAAVDGGDGACDEVQGE
ncbi:hypothetical protein MMPV_002471 [Pyropia vietnamensis]